MSTFCAPRNATGRLARGLRILRREQDADPVEDCRSTRVWVLEALPPRRRTRVRKFKASGCTLESERRCSPVHQHRRFSREEITTLVVADPVCCANDEDNDEDEDWEEEEEWEEEEFGVDRKSTRL